MGEFQEQTVVVTGASSGIGWHTARLFARSGARVLAQYNHNAAGAETLATEGQVHTVQANLAAPDGLPQLVAAARAHLGQVSVLVNNAGSLVRRARFLELDEPLWDAVLDLNLKAAYRCCRAFVPDMVERRAGVIVNVTSIAARNGGGLGAIAYSTAKAGLIGFTKGLAKEFAPLGIRVNAVSPGTVDTKYHQAFSTPAMLDSVRAATPLGRLGTPDEIAAVIGFLASPGASFIIGETIEINGGALME